MGSISEITASQFPFSVPQRVYFRCNNVSIFGASSSNSSSSVPSSVFLAHVVTVPGEGGGKAKVSPSPPRTKRSGSFSASKFFFVST